MACEDVESLNKWIDELGRITDMDVSGMSTFMLALDKRHEYFHENGCRLSDHGLETAYALDYTPSEIEKIFARIRRGETLDDLEILKFRSAMIYELGVLNSKRGWVQQMHFGPIRNNNTRLFRKLTNA